jgi:thymidylate synthase ThyX
MEKKYIEAMENAKKAYDILAQEFPEEAQYVVPMAYNVRWYFHVNLRALQWLCELRSTPAGHPSYRYIAQEMAKQERYLSVFRSCNRAFAQEESRRAQNWCGECDKCLFINLVLAPFVPRSKLKGIFGSEPLANPALINQLEVLVGLGSEHKPFECVGDPDESAVALLKVTDDIEWADVEHLSELADRLGPLQSFESLLTAQGENRVPAHWL